jgi:site-specific DNA recombinase
VPAAEIERFVLEQIKRIATDPSILTEAMRQAKAQSQHAMEELQAEECSIRRELTRYSAQLGRLAAVEQAGKLADIHDRVRAAEQRAAAVGERIAALGGDAVDEEELRAALSTFDPVWDALSPREQARVFRLLVERVDYDGAQGTVSVTFRPNGIKTLAQRHEEVAA